MRLTKLVYMVAEHLVVLLHRTSVLVAAEVRKLLVELVVIITQELLDKVDRDCNALVVMLVREAAAGTAAVVPILILLVMMTVVVEAAQVLFGLAPMLQVAIY